MDLDGKIAAQKTDLREKTYISWMKLHNFDKYSHSFITDWSADQALEMTDKIMQLKQLPTAIVVGSDPMAVGSI